VSIKITGLAVSLGHHEMVWSVWTCLEELCIVLYCHALPFGAWHHDTVGLADLIQEASRGGRDMKIGWWDSEPIFELKNQKISLPIGGLAPINCAAIAEPFL
jgi:hypothetical protein